MKKHKSSKKSPSSNSLRKNSLLITENNEEVCGNESNISIEDVISPQNQYPRTDNKLSGKVSKTSNSCEYHISDASVDGEPEVKKRTKKHKHKTSKNEQTNADTDVTSQSRTLEFCNENGCKLKYHDETEAQNEKSPKKTHKKKRVDIELHQIEDNVVKSDPEKFDTSEASIEDQHDVIKRKRKHKHSTTQNEEINWNSDSDVISPSQTLVDHKNTRKLKKPKETEARKKKKIERISVDLEPPDKVRESSSQQEIQDNHFKSSPAERDISEALIYDVKKRRKKNKLRDKNEKPDLNSDIDVISPSRTLDSRDELKINHENEGEQKTATRKKNKNLSVENGSKRIVIESSIHQEIEEKHYEEENIGNSQQRKSTEHESGEKNSQIDDSVFNKRGYAASRLGKRKVIELMKETTSVNRIKDELDLEMDDGMLQKLNHLSVEIPWSLPLIHKLAPSASVAPTSNQKTAIDDAGINLKLGKFTKEEDNKIKHNWKLFCKYHDWDEENYMPFLKNSKRSKYGVLRPRTFKKFVQFISHDFSDRLMYTVYARFQRIFSKDLRDCPMFTAEDDDIIMQYKVKSNATAPFADLAELLNRPRLAVLKRYKRLQLEKSFNKSTISWNKELIKELLLNMLEATGSKAVSDLKERKIETEEWGKISEEMGIPVDKLRRFWSMDLYTRVFNPSYDESFEEVRKELVKILYENYNDWREIDWQEIAKRFETYTPQRLYKMFMDVVKTKVPDYKKKDFKACFEFLTDLPQHRRRFQFLNEILQDLEKNKNNSK